MFQNFIGIFYFQFSAMAIDVGETNHAIISHSSLKIIIIIAIA